MYVLQRFFDTFKWSKAELAKKAKVTDRAIWNYLAGRRIPSQQVAERLEAATGGFCKVIDLRLGRDARRKR